MVNGPDIKDDPAIPYFKNGVMDGIYSRCIIHLDSHTQNYKEHLISAHLNVPQVDT